MKTNHTPFLLLLSFAAMAAEPAVELETVDRNPAWRISVGFRAAPGIKTSAAVDARAAATAAGALLRPAGRGASSTSGTGTSVSTKTEDLGSSTVGTTEADALDAAGFSADRTRWDFDNGYIDLDDGAGIEGETQNWHFENADDFSGGGVQGRTPYSSTTTSRSRNTRTETAPGSSSTKSSVSLREEWGDDLRATSDETACGFELGLDRTLWENGDFGVDVGIGWAWFDDVDAFSLRGRAYSAVATEKRTTTTTSGGTRVTTTETTTSTTESGTIITTISQPEFTDPDDFVNDDGSMGGGIRIDEDPPPGYRMPVLTVTDDRFSTSIERNPPRTDTRTTTSTSGTTDPGRTTTSSSSRAKSRTVDLRSEGTLSLQELHFGVRPFWKATPWLAIRGDLGILAVYSELETETSLTVDGAPRSSIRRDDDDWNVGGYAGLAADLATTDALTFSIGAEARFPHKRLRFDDGVVSGSVELAEWSAFAAVSYRF